MTQEKAKKKKKKPAAEEEPKKVRKKKAAPGKKAVRAKKGKKRRKGAKKPKLTVRTILKRVGLSVATLLILILVGALGAGEVAFKGPSPSLGDLLTVSMLETSALKFVPRIYYRSRAATRRSRPRRSPRTCWLRRTASRSSISRARPTTAG